MATIGSFNAIITISIPENLEKCLSTEEIIDRLEFSQFEYGENAHEPLTEMDNKVISEIIKRLVAL